MNLLIWRNILLYKPLETVVKTLKGTGRLGVGRTFSHTLGLQIGHCKLQIEQVPIASRGNRPQVARLNMHARLLIPLLLVSLAGCQHDPSDAGRLELIWGRHGVSDGRLQKPRAITIDAHDQLYLVDMTARIQVFDTEGRFLRGWQTPEHQAGRPTGLSISRRREVLVADTHYYRILIYSSEGKLLRTLGGTPGTGPGQFGLVTDAVEDRQGNFYVSEYGENDRIQKFSPEGRWLLTWGGHGSEPGRFLRPQKMAIDPEDRIWVADACNHRIQVFDTQGRLLRNWGTQGAAPASPQVQCWQATVPFSSDPYPDKGLFCVGCVRDVISVDSPNVVDIIRFVFASNSVKFELFDCFSSRLPCDFNRTDTFLECNVHLGRCRDCYRAGTFDGHNHTLIECIVDHNKGQIRSRIKYPTNQVSNQVQNDLWYNQDFVDDCTNRFGE